MIPLDAPVWGQLSSAGGDVRALLPKLVRGEDFRANLALLSEDLSHQLSFYNATAYVLPYLADLCTKLPLEDKLYLIAYTGPAVAAEGVASLPPDNEPYREFQEGLISLRRQAAALVADGAALELLRASGLELRQMFTLAALALIGDRRHAFYLYLQVGCWEFPAACPNEDCGWNDETLPLEEEPECLTPVSIGAWDGTSLDHEAVWLNGLLTAMGDEEFSACLPYLYGQCTCPECGERGPFWDWIHRFFEGEN